MTFENVSRLVCRAFFAVAFVLLALAVAEAGAHHLGYTILRHVYEAGQLLQYAAILLVFVLAILLRQIRDGLKSA